MTLCLRVENNSSFVRGKKKSREEIELYCLSQYNMKKLDKDGCRCELTIQYKNDKELESIIDEIYAEMERIADRRHCFIEADMWDASGERSW